MFVERMAREKFLEVFAEFPVIGIIGPRQSGKTTFISKIIPKLTKECIYYDLELPSDFELLTNAEFIFRQHAGKCIIIDEIQRKPELYPLIRALTDQQRENARFVILGSASPALIRKSAESLAGRIYYIEIQPFTIPEKPDYISQEQHLFRGGFPPALFAKSDNSAVNWVSSLIRTYIESDLPLLGLQVDPIVLRRFWTMLAHHHSGIWNASDFSRAMGLSHPTINKYLDYLEGAFLVRKLPPYYINIGKRLIKAPKVYIKDSGILNNLLNFNSYSGLLNHTISGAAFEGYVIENAAQSLIDKAEIFYYRTYSGAECDLVITKSQKVLACCEIKFSDSPSLSRGFYQTIADLDSTNNFIITPNSPDMLVNEHLLKCSITSFLNHHIPELL
jgi:predicted AAA+ superfamily ATPase